jgi:hypothetical protein
MMVPAAVAESYVAEVRVTAATMGSGLAASGSA